MEVSIIIRTRNEERWISDCLKAVFSQEYKDFEVIVVDNESTDLTLSKVRQFPVGKIVDCTEYLPGKALNLGIAQAQGTYIVCLSGHCIPTNGRWLGKLVENMADESVAGAYGRQEPLSFTPDTDKRDLLVVFGPEKKIQRIDNFFHNANSIIKRGLWERFPFDSQTTNIEDRLWARTVQSHGYTIVYEPEASVYHYHGIHQDGNKVRCQNVVRILESLNSTNSVRPVNIRDLNVVSFIPVKGVPARLGGKDLFEVTLSDSLNARFIRHTVVSTDNRQVADKALSMGADFAFIRDEDLSRDYIGLEKVYKFTLNKLEQNKVIPDIIVLLEITYPFREPQLIDNLILNLVLKGLDTILPARAETNTIWTQDDGGIRMISEAPVPRKYQRPVYLSYKGLCCVTRPAFILNEQIFGDNIGFFQIDNPYASIEIRSEKDCILPEILGNG
jgi:glycosyltransferase involved in cell wall biosynthesis